ncbi:MAG: hypothetical protein FWF12_00260 [Betaproteobacteria bacterium]|nr:hypothetical protein [Betaproteobacteria bacterium]
MNKKQKVAYRVWPDGTVQSVDDGSAFDWMSDDYAIINANSEEEAIELAKWMQSL